MSIIDNVRKLEKQLERIAERSDVPLQPIEIRKATLDEIEDLVEPASKSRRIFPYNRVTLEVVAPDGRRRAAMEAVLGERSDLGAAVSARLKSVGCPLPRDLRVRLKLVKRPGAEWGKGRAFRLQCEHVEEQAPAQEPARRAVGAAVLVIITGEATRDRYVLKGERTNVGRLPEVLDRDRRVVRRNHVVFTDSGSGTNLTVSRSHAHIAQMPSGEYRLFDDGSSAGTRIIRAGRTLALPPGSPRGTKLQPGDEIYFGRACARFDVDAPTWPPE